MEVVIGANIQIFVLAWLGWAWVSLASEIGNSSISSFRKAKTQLGKIYQELPQNYRRTLYCSCHFFEKKVSHDKCGYKPKRARTKKGKLNVRAFRLEWEHVVPAHAFGQSFRGWHSKKDFKECQGLGGRDCARKVDNDFGFMEADLYNLWPAIGEVNGNRSNYSMAMILGEAREYGGCDLEIQDKKVEPRPEVRGDIARTYMYMNLAYPGRGIISKKNRKLFEAWHKEDPVSEEEKARALAIQKRQGNCNPFVLDCKAKPLLIKLSD